MGLLTALSPDRRVNLEKVELEEKPLGFDKRQEPSLRL